MDNICNVSSSNSFPIFSCKKKKKAFTLLELFLALSLLSILLVCLFSTLTNIKKVEVGIDRARYAVLEEELFSSRMQKIFTSIDENLLSNLTVEKDGSLTFLFDNHLDPDPLFSGIIQGVIRKENATIVLLLKPIEKTLTCYRKEILLHDTANMKIEFLEPIKGKYQWSPTITNLPYMLRITILRENPKSFLFRLTSNVKPILYNMTSNTVEKS